MCVSVGVCECVSMCMSVCGGVCVWGVSVCECGGV